MVKLVWTELSINDLEDIFDYIAKDSPKYASITINGIYEKAQEIILNKNIGRIVPEINDISIREVLKGNYRIVYKNYLNYSSVLRVYHSYRKLDYSSINIK